MPLPTIRSLFGFLSKSKPPAYADGAIQGFLAGVQFALGPCGQALHDAIFQEALDEALRQLEPAIVQRAEAAGVVAPRTVIDLQTKQKEFQAKLDDTKDPKYKHYLEAINWMLPTNGH